MDYLETILAAKREALKKLLPLEGKLRASAILRNEYGGFASILDAGEEHLSIVAELALVQPVSGYREHDIDPVRLCDMFTQGGAHAISVVTEPTCYGGSMALLTQISRSSKLPVLSRDWFTHPAEVCQAIVCGADAINLVAAAMTTDRLNELYRLATGLGLDVMIEVHTLAEMESALDLEAGLICINNADPGTLVIDLDTTESLIDEAPASTIVLSSGGIATPHDAQRMLEAGASGIMIGEPLMRADIPQEILHDMLNVQLPFQETSE